MSSREVSVSGVLTCLFPATTVESLTLQVSRSGLLSSNSWHKSGDSDSSTCTDDTQSTQSQINIKGGDAAAWFKWDWHPENSKGVHLMFTKKPTVISSSRLKSVSPNLERGSQLVVWCLNYLRQLSSSFKGIPWPWLWPEYQINTVVLLTRGHNQLACM